MEVFKEPEAYRAWRRDCAPHVGLVPTMGALHEGHLSLIQQCVARNHRTVVSIFVNPIQFDNPEDLKKYPTDLDRDLRLCREAGVDAVFLPAVKTMYPKGFASAVEVAGLDKQLCGASRPGHFKGVCTVVLKLFLLLTPHRAYFGKKDYQQARILQRMVRDLDIPVGMELCDTVREPGGLALSSRNRRLSPSQMERAEGLYRGLTHARRLFQKGEHNAEVLIREVRKNISLDSEDRVDYIQLVDAYDLQPVTKVNRPGLLALAVYFGDVRLIDNVELIS